MPIHELKDIMRNVLHSRLITQICATSCIDNHIADDGGRYCSG